MSEIRVPKFGMSATDVEVLEILVEVGQSVEPGTPVVEAASDKVDFMVEAETAGTVAEIHCSVGDNVDMGALLITLTD
jgi:pyruvate/2-oxoglutarate dehydrogenase complex dihydrolipoamide acyltransferase (E2) component